MLGLAVLCTANWAWGDAPTPPPAPPAQATRAPQSPQPSFDLKRLDSLDDRRTSPVAKAKLGLRMYRDEMVTPTKPRRPQRYDDWDAYGDFKTHDYVLARITRKLAASNADLPTLKQHWDPAIPGDVTDCLAILMLMRGDRKVKDQVLECAQDRARPMRLRELAVDALGQYAVEADDNGLGAIFAKIIRSDPYPIYKVLEKAKPGGQPKLASVFPVRRAATDAIKKMHAAGMLLSSDVIDISRWPSEIPFSSVPVGPSANPPESPPK